MKKKIIAAILILLIAGLGIFFYKANKKDKETAEEVTGKIMDNIIELTK